MNHLPAAYFEDVYGRNPDPWGFDSRWYEARKYALTLAALPRQRYARAFEPGCANGALTEQLARRCDHLVAADLVPTVADRARARLRASTHVEVRCLAIPEEWPEGPFDLVVLSEIAYYLTSPGLTELLARMDDSLAPGGHVAAVHWTGETDYPLLGADVQARFDAHAAWTRTARYTESSFAMAIYERRRAT